MHFILFALVAALAGQAMAFTFLTVGKTNFNVTELLMVPDGDIKAACTSVCDPANTQLQSCADQTACQCSAQTVSAVRSCEQCWFTELIRLNQRPASPLMGSTPVLAAYGTACQAENITLAKADIGLTLPPNWNGPYGLFLDVPATIFGCIIVASMGVSAIWLLSNM